MANTQGIVLKEGAVLVADAHADFNRREFLYFLRAVNCGEIAASQLIMMGDMFDFYAPQCDFAARFAKPYLSLISQIASKIPVIYIEGNHDFCLEKSAFDLAGFKGADYPCSKPKLCADGLESARLNAAFNRCAADYKSEKIASYEFCSALDSDSATSSDYELARFSNPLHANFNDNEPNSTENSNSATQSQSAALNLNCFKNSHHSTQNASASVLQADNLLSKISGGLSNLNLQDKSSGDELKNQAAFARLENAKQNNQSDLLSLNPQNEPASDAQSSKAALNKQEKPTPSQLKQGDLLNLGSQNNPRQNELQSTPKASQSHNLTPQSPLQNGIFIIPFSAQPLRLRTPFGASVALAHGDNHLPFFTQRALLFLRQRWLLRSLNFIDRHLRYKISRRLFKHLLRKRLDYKIENFSQIADEKMQKYSDEIVIEGHFHQGEIFKFKDRIYANVPSFACQCRYFVVKYADEKNKFCSKELERTLMFGDDVLKTGSNEMELVDFRIFKKTESKVYEGIYGVNVAKVREIIKMPNLTELPGVPEYIEGIFDLRGVVIPVINLAKWMHIKEPTDEVVIKPRVIIAEFSGILIGFIVHEAKRIRRINWKNIEPANFAAGSGTGTLDKGKITGVTRIENDEVLLILDLESIVEELGIYSPKLDIDTKDIEKLEGIALVLDDSSTARKLVKDALEKMGLNVVEAKNGVEGIEKMNELYERYGESLATELRIILSDIEMPQMDGYHFASNMKNDDRFKSIPIVFNSSLSNEFSEIQSKEAGGAAYLTKFDASVFYQEVLKVIQAHSKSAK